jgi:hypothetical protein
LAKRRGIAGKGDDTGNGGHLRRDRAPDLLLRALALAPGREPQDGTA